MHSLIIILMIFLPISECDLRNVLSSAPVTNYHDANDTSEIIIIKPISYDIQLQLPLSESADPNIPLFTGRCVMRFELMSQIGPESAFISDSTSNRAKFKFDIHMLDHFENVSIVFNGNEIDVFNVLLSDSSMEVTVDQPVLFPGRYTMTIHRYKGLIGGAIYYRDAGEHAVFGSHMFPNNAPAVFPTILADSQKSTFSISVVHPIGTYAVTSGVNNSNPTHIDENWQMTNFATTPRLTPSMLCFALLPNEYSQITSSYTGINMTVHFNRFRLQPSQAKHLLNTATQILAILKDMFSSILPVPKIDLIVINNVIDSSCFGAIIVSEEPFYSSDYENQVFLISKWLIKQWIGGFLSISEDEYICVQEDLTTYIALKVVKRMTNDEFLQLSQLAKIYLTESIFLPGETLKLDKYPNEIEIQEKCGLKGATMFDSIEKLFNEKKILSKINELIYNSANGSFTYESFLNVFNMTLDDDIHVSQLIYYWRDHGGLPTLNMDRFGSHMKLSQLEGNITVKNGKGMWERMPLWPLPLHFSKFRLPIEIMISHGVHITPLRDGHIFSNLGFHHYYRVNYDIDTWKEIKNILTENATDYSMRERFQLVNDFCHFYANKMLPEPAATDLRNQFVELIKLRSSSFPICDAAIYKCVVGNDSKPKHIEKLTMIQLRKRIFDAFSNSLEMECRVGAAHDALNELCTRLYGASCL